MCTTWLSFIVSRRDLKPILPPCGRASCDRLLTTVTHTPPPFSDRRDHARKPFNVLYLIRVNLAWRVNKFYLKSLYSGFPYDLSRSNPFWGKFGHKGILGMGQGVSADPHQIASLVLTSPVVIFGLTFLGISHVIFHCAQDRVLPRKDVI